MTNPKKPTKEYSAKDYQVYIKNAVNLVAELAQMEDKTTHSIIYATEYLNVNDLIKHIANMTKFGKKYVVMHMNVKKRIKKLKK